MTPGALSYPQHTAAFSQNLSNHQVRFGASGEAQTDNSRWFGSQAGRHVVVSLSKTLEPQFNVWTEIFLAGSDFDKKVTTLISKC